MRDAIVKDFMRDAIVKNDNMRDAIVKDDNMRDAIVKDLFAMKGGVKVKGVSVGGGFSTDLMRDAIVKNDNMRDAIVKDDMDHWDGHRGADWHNDHSGWGGRGADWHNDHNGYGQGHWDEDLM